jgi:hypothetical protein
MLYFTIVFYIIKKKMNFMEKDLKKKNFIEKSFQRKYVL